MRPVPANCGSARLVSDMRLLVHVITGSHDATRAALGLLVAKSALEEGHAVEVFLAGDAAELSSPEVARSTDGLGTGNAAEWLAHLRQHGVPIYVSGMSAKARGIEPEWLTENGYLPSPPTKLVALAAEADRVLVY